MTAKITGAVPVANGGSGSTSASAARTALGVAVGSDVQAFDSDNAVTDAQQTFSKAQIGLHIHCTFSNFRSFRF